MSSLVKQKKRPYWYCRFRGADGTQHTLSTRTASRAEAKLLCAQMQEAADLARKEKLSPERARRVIEEAVAKLMEQCGEALPNSTLREYFTAWLKEKKATGAETTYLRYEGIVKRFLDYMGRRAGESLGGLTKTDILGFREKLTEQVSRGTVNTYLKVLRVALGRAVREEILLKNPAALVDKLPAGHRQGRRPFTFQELAKVLQVANKEWQTMILIGLYSGGQRLHDVANLLWTNIDLQTKELTLVTSKTGRTVIHPLHADLVKHLESLDAGDDPKAALCPNLAGKPESWLSNKFFELMAAAGLVASRAVHDAEHGKYRGPKKGRSIRRKLSEISYHSLRHMATSELKNRGVSDAIAMDIVGHQSQALSKNYTHVDGPTKRAAIDKLPSLIAFCEAQQQSAFDLKL